MSSMKWVLAAPVVALAAIYFVKPFDWNASINRGYYQASPVNQASEKEKFSNAAQECWKSYDKKSLSPMDKLGIAKMCEDLEKTRDSF